MEEHSLIPVQFWAWRGVGASMYPCIRDQEKEGPSDPAFYLMCQSDTDPTEHLEFDVSIFLSGRSKQVTGSTETTGFPSSPSFVTRTRNLSIPETKNSASRVVHLLQKVVRKNRYASSIDYSAAANLLPRIRSLTG